MRDLVAQVYNPPRFENSISIQELYPQFEFRLFSLARYALKEALTDLGIKKGDLVLFPSFICRDSLASVNSLGATVVYYDVKENLTPTLQPKDWPKAKVVLAVNYFGFPQPLEPFQQYCKVNDAILIEDNAHGFLSSADNGVPLGLRGDYGICSIRKTLPMPNGALLLSRNFKTKLTSLEIVPAYSRKEFLRYLTPFITPKGWQLLTRIFRFGRTLIRGSAIPKGEKEDELCIPGNPQPCQVQLYLQRFHLKAEVERRRELYIKLSKELSSFAIDPVFQELPFNVAPYSFAFYSDENEVKKVQKKLEELGLEMFLWPELPWGLEVPDYYKKLYLVRFLW